MNTYTIISKIHNSYEALEETNTQLSKTLSIEQYNNLLEYRQKIIDNIELLKELSKTIKRRFTLWTHI